MLKKAEDKDNPRTPQPGTMAPDLPSPSGNSWRGTECFRLTEKRGHPCAVFNTSTIKQHLNASVCRTGAIWLRDSAVVTVGSLSFDRSDFASFGFDVMR
jgi:hypothetical protein